MPATLRQASLQGEYFHRQTEGLFIPTLHVDYLVFDFGERSGAVDVAKANLLVADLAFNDTHRQLIFQVSSAYFRLLNAKGQREAAEASLKNAQTIEQDAESRLANGLATKPDVLESTAARSQADYDLQAAIGGEDIAHGDLATAMGLPPETQFKVQDIHELPTPTVMADSIDQEVDRAFAQRPELMQEVARIRAAEGALKQARSAYFPTIGFSGDGGLARAYGQQDLYPGHYAQGEYWSVGMQMKWTLFDGGRREHEIVAAQAEKRSAQAGIDALHDQIGNEVWAAYSNMKTALRQQQAAAALLDASSQSYEAARESYSYGIRSQLDVISAQKTLALGAVRRCSCAHPSLVAGGQPGLPHRRPDSGATSKGGSMRTALIIEHAVETRTLARCAVSAHRLWACALVQYSRLVLSSVAHLHGSRHPARGHRQLDTYRAQARETHPMGHPGLSMPRGVLCFHTLVGLL